MWGAYERGGKEADEKVLREGYTGWMKLLGRRSCGPSRRHGWFVEKGMDEREVTHVRLSMFPDGGIARFRLFGVAVPVWPADEGEEVELSGAVMGGVAVGCSDEHFGKRGNLLLPGRGKDMGDGWETKRSRGVGHTDWVVVKLGARGRVSRVVVDTIHFRGNFPQAVRVEGLDAEGEDEAKGDDERWVEVVGIQRCEKDKEHEFSSGVLKEVASRAFTHMKIVIIPDGGVKRFRVFGTKAI